MRAIPIPDELPGQRIILGEPGDPTREDVRPCEYLVYASSLYPGRPTFTAVIELDDADRAAIAEGARLVLTLDGAEMPWTLDVIRS